MGKDKKNAVKLSPYMKKVHLLGRLSSLLCILVFGGVGVAVCLYYDLNVSFGSFLSVWGYIFVILLLSSIMEFMGSLPVLGSGATYLSFITGNVSTMKLPAVTAAMNKIGADVEQGTDEYEVLTTICTCVSSLLVIAAITVVICFTDVFSPVLEWGPIQPAFTYIMPAISGLLLAGPLFQNPTIIIPTVIGGVAAMLLSGGNTMVVMFVCVAVALVMFFIKSRNMTPVNND